jgi:hypothetical protein
MQSSRDYYEPAEHELRIRAAARVARRRSFMVSAVVVGSLIILNLYLYSRSHDAVWLLLDAVFAGTLGFRAWVTFRSDRRDDARISREVERIRPVPGQAPGPWQGSPVPWTAPPVQQQAPAVPAVPPPPAWVASPPPSPAESGQPKPATPAADETPPPSTDPWAGSWSF